MPNGKRGKQRSRKLAGRIPKWGIRLPHVERRIFARVKRLEPAELREKLQNLHEASIKIQIEFEKQHAILQDALQQYHMNGAKTREQKILAIEKAVRKVDALRLKQIKINMYYHLAGFHQYILETRELRPVLSNFTRRKVNLSVWRRVAGNILRQKRLEWEIKERGENPEILRKSMRTVSLRAKNSILMRRYIQKLIDAYKNENIPPSKPNRRG